MSVSETPKQLITEWKYKVLDQDEDPSIAREEGFVDAVDPNFEWNNTYARFSSEWDDYAHGFDEGKDLLKKKSGKVARKEAFIELLNLDIKYTPENNYSQEELEDDVPFFTEAYLYALIGKQDARTILAYVRNLAEACGFDCRELEREAVRQREN